MFIYLATVVLISAFLASIYQHFILKLSKKPLWVYRLHYGAIFAFAYIVIQVYNAAVFLTVATAIILVNKLYDLAMPQRENISILTENSRDMWLFLLIFWAIRTLVYDYSPVPSGSMEPTLLTGDLIAINKMAYQVKIPPISTPLYQFSKPKRGDVIVFNSPITPNEYWIKGVIAVAGDRVEYVNKQYFVNGKPYVQSNHELNYDQSSKTSWMMQASEEIDGKTHKIQLDKRQFDKSIDITVPDNMYFVSGDNRDYSLDSRMFGPIPEENVVGKATHVITQFTLPWLISFQRSGHIE